MLVPRWHRNTQSLLLLAVRRCGHLVTCVRQQVQQIGAGTGSLLVMHDACHTDDGFTSADNGGLWLLAAERSRAAVQPDTQGKQGQGLCSSMSMARVTTMLELLSDPEHELHSQQGVAA